MTNNLKEPGQRVFGSLGINLDKVPLEQLDYYIAVENYLTDNEELPSDVPPIEQIYGYLEAFYHLSEVKDWERAKAITRAQLGTPTNEELYAQLGTWGYYQKQIELCSKLLGKLDASTDTICLNTLGTAHDSLSNYHQAINYYEQDLIITHQTNDRRGEGITLGNLGNSYYSLNNYSQAIKFFQQALQIAQDVNDRRGEGNALGNLGNVYDSIGDYSQAIEYHSLA